MNDRLLRFSTWSELLCPRDWQHGLSKRSLLLPVCILVFLLIGQWLMGQRPGPIPSKAALISYHTYGEGRPILVINGVTCMHSAGFESMAKTLSALGRVILYDQRGTGQSRLLEEHRRWVSLDLMIHDIERLRVHLGIDQWVVFGHSFGGMLASYYAANHPDRVEALILSASGGLDMEIFDVVGPRLQNRLSPLERDSMRYWARQVDRGDTTYRARYRRGLAVAPAYVVDRKWIPTIAHRLTQGNMRIYRWVVDDMADMPFDCRAALRSFDRAVLIIQGLQDIIPRVIAEKSHAIFPNSKLVFLDQCGHYGWLDQADDFFSVIDVFLAENYLCP